jgi:starvation-inducible DNA-binding protein
MKNSTTRIGLDKKKSKALSEKLNVLLANYQVLYMNTRGFHWNIKGEKFFELHLKFEELYNNFLLKIDELAERVLTLGHTPMHAYSDYIKNSEIKEQKDCTDGKDCLESLLKGLSILIVKQRELLNLSSVSNDEGTNALMSDYIREQEKLVWMLNAYLS